MLPEVDVEDFEAAVRHVPEEMTDRRTRNGVALGERAEAEDPGTFGKRVQRVGQRDVVPGHTLADLIVGNPVRIERHLHGTRRITDPFEQILQALVGEYFHDLVPQRIVADGADRNAREPELSGVESEIGRGPADLSSFGENVPEGLPHTYE